METEYFQLGPDVHTLIPWYVEIYIYIYLVYYSTTVDYQSNSHRMLTTFTLSTGEQEKNRH